MSKHGYSCTAADPPFFPDLCLFKCVELRVHGKISVVCQNMTTAVLLWTRHFLPRLIPVQVWIYFRVHRTTIYVVCQNMITPVRLRTRLFFSDLCLYKRIEFGVHGTTYVVCQNMITPVLLWTRFFRPTYACTSVKSLGYTVQYVLCVKIGLLMYCCGLAFFSRRIPVQVSRV